MLLSPLPHPIQCWKSGRTPGACYNSVGRVGWGERIGHVHFESCASYVFFMCVKAVTIANMSQELCLYLYSCCRLLINVIVCLHSVWRRESLRCDSVAFVVYYDLGTAILRVIFIELCRRIRVKFPKSWIQNFGIQDLGLPKSWIQDLASPKSWIQDFGSPKSWIQDFGSR